MNYVSISKIIYQATPLGMLKERTLRNNKKWNLTLRNVDRFKKKQNGYTINEN
jgi:hypothetical protein